MTPSSLVTTVQLQGRRTAPARIGWTVREYSNASHLITVQRLNRDSGHSYQGLGSLRASGTAPACPRLRVSWGRRPRSDTRACARASARLAGGRSSEPCAAGPAGSGRSSGGCAAQEGARPQRGAEGGRAEGGRAEGGRADDVKGSGPLEHRTGSRGHLERSLRRAGRGFPACCPGPCVSRFDGGPVISDGGDATGTPEGVRCCCYSGSQ